MQHCHRESECATTGRVVCGSFDGLIFDVTGQGIVEIPFIGADLKIAGANITFGEQGFDLAGFRVRETYQRLLHPPEVKRRFLTAHRLFQTFHVAINVFVQQFEEQAKILRVTFVRRGGHQEVVIRHL